MDNIIEYTRNKKPRRKKMDLKFKDDEITQKEKEDLDIEDLDLDLIKTHYGHLGKDNFNSEEIELAAYQILKKNGYYYYRNSIPIVKVANKFGLPVIQENLDYYYPKNIRINGDTKYLYNNNKVILVEKGKHLYDRRFYVAHELAHYLFDYPNDPSFKTKDLFEDNFIQNENFIAEKRADKFAISILMPVNLFYKQLQIAKNYFVDDFLINTYLSRFFEVPLETVLFRMKEVEKMVGQVNA